MMTQNSAFQNHFIFIITEYKESSLKPSSLRNLDKKKKAKN